MLNKSVDRQLRSRFVGIAVVIATAFLLFSKAQALETMASRTPKLNVPKAPIKTLPKPKVTKNRFARTC